MAKMSASTVYLLNKEKIILLTCFLLHYCIQSVLLYTAVLVSGKEVVLDHSEMETWFHDVQTTPGGCTPVKHNKITCAKMPTDEGS